jgi:hypothetical protein
MTDVPIAGVECLAKQRRNVFAHEFDGLFAHNPKIIGVIDQFFFKLTLIRS